MSSPLFLINSIIDEAQSDVDGWIVLADNNPLTRFANFLRNLGATGLIRCAIGFAPPTLMSQTDPLPFGDTAFLSLV